MPALARGGIRRPLSLQPLDAVVSAPVYRCAHDVLLELYSMKEKLAACAELCMGELGGGVPKP